MKETVDVRTGVNHTFNSMNEFSVIKRDMR